MSVALVVVAVAVAYTVARRLWLQRKKTRGANRRRSMLIVVAILGLQTVFLAPSASAAGACDAPNPERPGAGMVGAIDPPALDHGDPAKGNYGKYSYAGAVWHVYQDNNGGPCIPDASATIDTWMGNQFFNVGKNLVGATNSLHYAMLSQDSMLAPLDKAVATGAKTFYKNVYVEWFAVAALVLAVMLFRYIWTGDLASIGKRGLWALAGMWLAASVFSLGGVYTAVDSTLIQTTSQIQAGFLSSDQVKNQRNVLPNSLYDNVIYTNWARGEFGDPNSAHAKKYGANLLDDQAWAKTDVNSADDQSKVDAKKQDYKSMPSKLGTDEGFFRGTDGSRTGSGFLAMFQGFSYALFQLLAKAAVLMAQVLIRILILASPVIGLAAMVMPDLLRKVARAAGAIALSVLAFSAMAGAHALLLGQIFDASNQLSLLAQMLLAALVTVVFLLIGKPVKRMRQMVELSIGGNGVSGLSNGGGLFHRLRRGSRDAAAVTPQEEFWSNVSEAGNDTTPVDPRLRPRRGRPEGVVAGATVAATATRLDTDGETRAEENGFGRSMRPGLENAGRGGNRQAIAPMRDGATAAPPYRGYTGPTQALQPAGSSRFVDAFPAAASRADRAEESVVVPSQVITPSGEPATPPARPPRPADPEMVGGKPVFVLYRPSTGIEVGEQGLFDSTVPRRS
jgi:hypothetical protein